MEKEIKMSLIEKIATARTMISINKTGLNKFSNFSYYQIDEIYAQAKDIFKDLGLITTMNTEVVGDGLLKFILTVSDNEHSLDYSVITELNKGMKGAQPAQEAGATITYMTKYLYGLLLMIDDGKSDPDATNDMEKGSTATGKSKSLSRSEMQTKIKGLPKDKFDAYYDEVAKENGRPTDLKYWKNDKLIEICKKENFM